MIEDKELRDLFRIESKEHVRNLEAKLLHLEKTPSDPSALEEVFREAHSLKGAARMVGVKDVELIAHRMEDIFGGIRKGVASLTPGLIDRLCRGLDAIKKLVDEATSGAPSGVATAAVLDALSEKTEPSTPPGKDKKESGTPGPAHSPTHSPIHSDDEPAHGHAAGPEEAVYRIDTVRVETSRLDELMTQSAELIVMKNRMSHTGAEMDEIMELLEAGPGTFRPGARLKALRDALSENTSRLEYISSALSEGVRSIRMLPLSTLFGLFPRAARDMARERGKEAALETEGGDTGADKRIIEEMKDPIMHMVRNAIDHGIEAPDDREKAGKPRAGKILLRARRTDANIIIEVIDDGRGLDVDAIKRVAVKRGMRAEEELERLDPAELGQLIFASGFSTSSFVTDTFGRGVGLDVARSNVEGLKGSIQVESRPGSGCVMRVTLPVTLATVRVIIAKADKRHYAIPVESVETSLLIPATSVFSIEGRDTVETNGRAVSVARLLELLGCGGAARNNVKPAGGKVLPCVILRSGEKTFGVFVDELLDEQAIVLKPHGAPLKRVPNVSGAAILANGEICMVLSPVDLMKTMRKRTLAARAEVKAEKEERKRAILLAEDSITTRTQERRILEAAGYEVVTAVDGVDALGKLATRQFDAIVTDIMMPNMDGLTLTSMIRRDKRYMELPIILVTMLASDEDKKRGLEAGANAYIPKPAFDQRIFLETLKRLV
ncbi:MAG: hybrid sensor histidine kinase/response regulator [Deltaproteobacteria bacterium]|nr:hybrid sensor histidine kinase/response regulator [Deltaproteobacteria bacterium]